MKIFPVLAALALGLYAATADAKTFAVPDDDPIATISVPDSWGPNPYEGESRRPRPMGRSISRSSRPRLTT